MKWIGVPPYCNSKSLGIRTEMKRKIQVIHEDQDRNQRRMGNQRRTNTVSKKGRLRGIWR